MSKIQMIKTKTSARETREKHERVDGRGLLLFGILSLCILNLFRISDFGFRIYSFNRKLKWTQTLCFQWSS